MAYTAAISSCEKDGPIPKTNSQIGSRDEGIETSQIVVKLVSKRFAILVAHRSRYSSECLNAVNQADLIWGICQFITWSEVLLGGDDSEELIAMLSKVLITSDSKSLGHRFFEGNNESFL